jgi:hypothetical protein
VRILPPAHFWQDQRTIERRESEEDSKEFADFLKMERDLRSVMEPADGESEAPATLMVIISVVEMSRGG